ncbi:unknown protein [Seminavis robusta]|uniref:Uncharacterized protein n=1 Tax=Seminavis robusta TaxID=568900 RepID=A0A9N8D730_9STRA|nr:unknown protein [Seminavis robusta]|eukprot:Sro4_g003310.1 n/a (396) ;mRNA; f:114017-115326
MAVKDAIAILELENVFTQEELKVSLERSLFGCRPDIMVVRGKRGNDTVGLLAIEMKQPVPKEPLRDYPTVVGHAFDHAMAMKAFHVGTDLVLVSSFKESFLCSLKKSDLMTTAPRDQEMKEGANQEMKEKATTTPTSQGQVLPSQSPPNMKSPPKAKSFSHDASLLFLAPRRLKAHELVKLVYTALKIAKKDYRKYEKTIYCLKDQHKYCFPRVLRVTQGEKTCDWGRLEATVGQEIKEGTPRTKKSKPGRYYIVGSLGQGTTLNVFQALNWNGQLVALKVYVNNEKEGGPMTKDDFLKQAESATKTEVENLKDIYSPLLNSRVRAIQILGFWCVVTPFFEPIPQAERTTDQTLGGIREALGRFKKKGKKYQESDIRWHDVGTLMDSAEGGIHFI